MPQTYLISEGDRKLIQEALAWIKGRRLNTPSKSPQPEIGGPAIDVYIAYVPTGGIPSMLEAGGEWITDTGTGTDDSPQHVDCEIYRILGEDKGSPYLSDCGFTKRVYNVFPFPITEHQWVMVSRDKFGSWVATSFGSGTSDTNPKAGAGSNALCMTSIGGLPIDRIPGYVAGRKQALTHSANNCLVWQNVGPCNS